MERGQIVGLHTTASRRGPVEAVANVEVLANLGLAGDHHQRAGSSRQVMLVEAEVLDELALEPGQVREQIAIRGLRPLAAGDVLTIGSTRIEVVKPRNPCKVMDEMVRPGLRAELEGRAGWCARAVVGGTISIGDEVVRGRVDDPEWLHAFRAALATWEADESSADPDADLLEARDRCLAAVAAIEADAGAPTSAAVDPPQADPTISAYRRHDMAHTALIESARRHLTIARPHVEALTETYRTQLARS